MIMTYMYCCFETCLVEGTVELLSDVNGGVVELLGHVAHVVVAFALNGGFRRVDFISNSCGKVVERANRVKRFLREILSGKIGQ